MTEQFKKTIENIDPKLLCLKELGTLQVNLGNLCNQSCSHCHVQASPKGENIMPKSVMQKIINDPSQVVDEMVDGYVKAFPDLVAKTENPRVLKYKNALTHLKTLVKKKKKTLVPRKYSSHTNFNNNLKCISYIVKPDFFYTM